MKKDKSRSDPVPHGDAGAADLSGRNAHRLVQFQSGALLVVWHPGGDPQLPDGRRGPPPQHDPSPPHGRLRTDGPLRLRPQAGANARPCPRSTSCTSRSLFRLSLYLFTSFRLSARKFIPIRKDLLIIINSRIFLIKCLCTRVSLLEFSVSFSEKWGELWGVCVMRCGTSSQDEHWVPTPTFYLISTLHFVNVIFFFFGWRGAVFFLYYFLVFRLFFRKFIPYLGPYFNFDVLLYQQNYDFSVKMKTNWELAIFEYLKNLPVSMTVSFFQELISHHLNKPATFIVSANQFISMTNFWKWLLRVKTVGEVKETSCEFRATVRSCIT